MSDRDHEEDISEGENPKEEGEKLTRNEKRLGGNHTQVKRGVGNSRTDEAMSEEGMEPNMTLQIWPTDGWSATCCQVEGS